MQYVKTIQKGMLFTLLAAPVLVQADAMNIDGNGDVGIGIETPGEALHVVRGDGTAQVLVEEMDSTVAIRTLFRLINSGNTKFEITNLAGESWAFVNAGADFRISRQGSNELEFRVLNNGNVEIAGMLTQNSDRNAKQNIIPVDPAAVLEKVALLPISAWEYKDAPGQQHVGPMAQDFHASFGLGANDTGISSIDTGGVALAAIQGLEAENAQLRSQNLSLEQRLHQQEDRLAQLESLLRQISGR